MSGITCPDERHIIRTQDGVIDGYLMSELSRHLVDREWPDKDGLLVFVPKTNNPCCLQPANWEGYGEAHFVPPHEAEGEDRSIFLISAIQNYYHEGRRHARECRCKFCGCTVHWATEWVDEARVELDRLAMEQMRRAR